MTNRFDRRRWSRLLVALLALAAAGRPAAAQGRIHVARLDERLLHTWSGADSIDDFRQREPLAGRPATERTVVRIGRDADALIIGIWAYDRDTAGIRSSQLRRDADLGSDDNVTVLIDGLSDRRSAFVFSTNPRGAMWDAQFIGVDNLNVDWNGVWSVVTRRSAGGWEAEFRIPFRTLRFTPRAATSFGFNVRRFIRRRNEEDLWQSSGRAEGLYQLLREGSATDLGELPAGRPVDVRPYLLGRAEEPRYDTLGVRQAAGAIDAKAGLDAKLGITPTLTGDLTLNTDFAQVEVDRQVINLTRFPLFFPEKREFFLESSGIFGFGFNERTQLFYSRRIGLVTDSAGNTAPVPIIGGARLYGRTGPWTIGVLDARTGGSDDANNAVVRIRHDLFARSYLGAMATVRSAPGAGGAQSAFGLDADFPLVVHGQNLEPTFWLAGTRVPGTAGTPTAWRVATDFPNDLFDNFISLYHIGAGYSPVLGFVRRTGIWETTSHVDFQPRPHVLGLRRLDIKVPIPEWDVIAPEGTSLLRAATWQTAWFEWRPLGGEFQSGDGFEVNLQRNLDAPADTFGIFPGVAIAPGRYWWTRWELQYWTSPTRPVDLTTLVSWGGFYDGRSLDAALSVNWRGGGHIILGLDAERNAVRLPQGRFTALQLATRLEYDPGTRVSLQAFIQHNNEDARADFNLRFHWIPTIGDDLYVVWNSGYPTNAGAADRFPDRRLFSRPLDGAFEVKVVHRLAP